MRRLQVTLVGAGVTLGVAAELSAYLPDSPASAAGDFVVGLLFIAGGSLVWRRSSATGALMAATGFAWYLGTFTGALAFLHRGPLVHLLLGYPRGRLESRSKRIVVAAAYADALVNPLGRSNLATLALMGALLVTSVVGHSRAGGAERRARATGLVATVGVVSVLATAAIAHMYDAGSDNTLLWAYEIVLAVVSAGLCADLLWGRWTQAAVTGLVVDLGDLERATTLGARLGRSVGDPSLELGYWDAVDGGYIDEAGRPLGIPAPPENRSVLLVRDGAGEPAAAVVHDPAVLGEPRLADAVRAAVRIAVGNVELQAQVLERVEEVRASRQRLVEAADAERRRLEQELREATEPRLGVIAGLLEASEGGPGELRSDLEALRDELGELARGLHPHTLTESGLAAALEELAARLPFPVEVCAGEDELPPAVAAAAYFVCSEGLANAAKHAGASRVSLAARQLDGSLVVEVSDDGAGGAHLGRGTGLQGLTDRVEALGGQLQLHSVPGAGTRLRAEIPLADRVAVRPGLPPRAEVVG